MDIILHVFGACADNHAHFDLTDLIIYGTGLGTTYVYAKTWIKNQLKKIRRKD